MLKGLFILDDYKLIYDNVYQKIEEYVDIYTKPQTTDSIQGNLDLLRSADILFTGWGCPVMDESFLRHAPNLQTVFYGAGTIKSIVTDAFWERNIRITSAYAANAIPVVEFTISQILFSLKRGWYFAMKMKKEQRWIEKEPVPGVFGSTVGIVSLGQIGKNVCQMLQQFDIRIIAYDPYIAKEEAKQLGVELCSLTELFTQADVVSLHTPWLKETEGLIDGELIAKMKYNATLINTSRGAIIKEDELITILKERRDLYAILDVTYPEPPSKDSALFTLENVILTPHMAGSMYTECLRMGEYMLSELERYLQGAPLKWEITKEKARLMA